MMDPWIAVAVAGGVLTIFMAGLLVQRRPRWTQVPITEVKLNEITTRLTALEGKQTQNDHDVKNIRMAMQSMPTKDSLAEVRLEVSHLNGKVDGMHDTLHTNGHSLRRIEDFLINAAVANIAGKGTEAKT